MAETIKQVRNRLVKSLTEDQLKSGKRPNIKCSECGYRVRGINHENGTHHKNKKK